jgi:hypothetical protein
MAARKRKNSESFGQYRKALVEEQAYDAHRLSTAYGLRNGRGIIANILNTLRNKLIPPVGVMEFTGRQKVERKNCNKAAKAARRVMRARAT